MMHFQNEQNVEEFASIFKSGWYEQCTNNKNRNSNYDFLSYSKQYIICNLILESKIRRLRHSSMPLIKYI